MVGISGIRFLHGGMCRGVDISGGWRYVQGIRLSVGCKENTMQMFFDN